MEKIKSLADLKRIRDEKQSGLQIREKGELAENLVQVKVAMATCGIASGARETMEFMMSALEKRGVDALVTQTGPNFGSRMLAPRPGCGILSTSTNASSARSFESTIAILLA